MYKSKLCSLFFFTASELLGAGSVATYEVGLVVKLYLSVVDFFIEEAGFGLFGWVGFFPLFIS